MIVVDTSALICVVLGEPQARVCSSILEHGGELVISAATVVEYLIVADRKKVRERAERLFDGLGFDIAGLSPADTRFVADVYRRWGKGFHPAALNFGDCFAYALAKDRGCPLLFVGDDFSRTDVRSALEEVAPRA